MTRKELASVIRDHADKYAREAFRLRRLAIAVEKGHQSSVEIAELMKCKEVNLPNDAYFVAWQELYKPGVTLS